MSIATQIFRNQYISQIFVLQSREKRAHCIPKALLSDGIRGVIPCRLNAHLYIERHFFTVALNLLDFFHEACLKIAIFSESLIHKNRLINFATVFSLWVSFDFFISIPGITQDLLVTSQ